jgi:hypothetical protein
MSDQTQQRNQQTVRSIVLVDVDAAADLCYHDDGEPGARKEAVGARRGVAKLEEVPHA